MNLEPNSRDSGTFFNAVFPRAHRVSPTIARAKACALIDGLSAEALLADRGYDTDEIVETAMKIGR